LPAVINYDLPYAPEDYIHRIGRTGRAGASGMALSLMLESDDRLLAAIEKLTNRKLEAVPIDVPRPPREGRPRRDIPEARPRRDRPARRDAGSTVGQSADPFFYKPYEPGDDRPSADTADASRARRTEPRRARAPVAALLGGLRRSP
jgi:superfamily II DNA/RNA helicase